MGWGLAFGLAAVVVVVTIAAHGDLHSGSGVTVYAEPPGRVFESARIWLLFIGCATAAGLGSYVALSAINLSKRAQRAVSLAWAAIGLATVAANLFLSDHPGPDWWYETITRSAAGPAAMREQIQHWNPWTVHLALTLPIAGALGGFVQSYATATGTAALRMRQAILPMMLWSAAFFAARFVVLIGVYLMTAVVIDTLEAIGSWFSVLRLLGPFLGGYITGYLVAAIASLSPGMIWREDARGPRV